MPLTDPPGIFFRELDFTHAARTVGETLLLCAGGATKGAINTPTLVNSEAELVDAFGPPILSDYAIQSAVQYLRRGRSCVFLRLAGASVETASVGVVGLTGGSVAAAGVGSVEFTGNPSEATAADFIDISDGVISVSFEFDSDSSVTAGKVPVTIGADASATMANFIAAVNASILDVTALAAVGAANPKATITHNRTGARAGVSIADTEGGARTNITVVDFAGGAAPGPSTGLIQFLSGSNAADGDLVTISDDGGATTTVFEFDTGDGVAAPNVAVAVGGTAAISATNLRTAINNSSLGIVATDALGDATTPPKPSVFLLAIAGGSASSITATTIVAGATTATVAGEDATAPSTQASVMTVGASTPGTWGNGVDVQLQATTVPGAPSGNFDLLVLAARDPTLPTIKSVVERYNNLSLDSTDSRFVTDVVAGKTSENAVASKFIVIESVAGGSSVSPATYTLGTGNGRVGHDGIVHNAATGKDGLFDAAGAVIPAAYIGVEGGAAPTGLKAARDTERVVFNIAAVPGVSHTQIIDEMIDLATSRGDSIALVDPPLALTVDQVIDWHNGVLTGVPGVPNPPNKRLDSSFATVNYSWVKVHDSYNKVDIFIPPSGLVAGLMARTDVIARPWFPSAGHTRGRLSVLAVETSPSAAERTRMLRNGNSVNPIVDFQGSGPTLFGSQTLLRRDSILQQVHVRRLLIFARAAIRTSVKFLLWEPNDDVTRRRFVKRVGAILESIKGGRGLEDFAVIADKSVNTPDVINERRLVGKVLLKPFNAVERIEIDFALFDQGADFNERVV